MNSWDPLMERTTLTRSDISQKAMEGAGILVENVLHEETNEAEDYIDASKELENPQPCKKFKRHF